MRAHLPFIFTTLFSTGVALPPVAKAQQVLLDGVPVAGSPTVVNQVAVPDGEVLTLESGASISTADHAITDLADGSTITVNNDGIITSTGNDGINANGSSLLLTNSGTIDAVNIGVRSTTITSMTNSNQIEGGTYGIFVSNIITGLTNSGSIEGGTYGLRALSTIVDLNNSGTITGTTRSAILAVDITSLNNSGTISSATNGVQSTGDITNLTNSGSIEGSNYGILSSNTIISLTNSGLIEGANQSGVDADAIVNLINSGSISGNDRGIQSDTSISSLTNSGSIEGGTYGIRAAGAITSLTNSGSIEGGTYGIHAVDTLTSLTNSGSIEGGTYGVISSNTITNLTNSGSIEGGTYGVFASGALTSLTNSGTIIGNGGTAIREAGAGDTVLTLQRGSIIQGLVDLGGGTNTLVVGKGLSMATTFVTAVPDVIDTNGAPFVVNGTTVVVIDPTSFAGADSGISNLSSSVSSTVTARLNETDSGTTLALRAQPLDGTGVTVTPVAATPNDAPNDESSGSSPHGAWLKAFGGLRKTASSDAAVNSQNLFGGFAFGIDRRANRDLRLGAFGGIAAGQVEVGGNTQSIATESYFGGVYGRQDATGWWLDFAVTAGVSDHDSARLVANSQIAGGLETARGNYNGWFVAPEATFGTKVQAMGRTFKPSLRARYVGMWFDGYTETDSAASLSVNDREAHTLAARFQIALPLVDTTGRRSFELRAGIDGHIALGNDKVSATLLAQQIEFSSGGARESVDGFIGASYVDRIASNTQVFLSSELGTGTQTDVQASAQAGIRISF